MSVLMQTRLDSDTDSNRETLMMIDMMTQQRQQQADEDDG